jgi:DNA repair protein RadA/Sms
LPKLPTRPPAAVFVCQECGAQAPKWAGRCAECGQWNTLVEEQPVAAVAARRPGPRLTAQAPVSLAGVQTGAVPRLSLPLREVNQVLGGGIVPGSLVLVGGDPGIGKSTLLLQVSELVARQAGVVLYASGEESAGQIKLRADRLGVGSERLLVYPESDLTAIVEQVERLRPAMVVIDSIQTIYRPDLTSAPGSVSQVRESAGQLMLLAKGTGVPIFLVGHVNKEGAIAGPRVLEHIVDTVLYLEGDRHHAFRILRSVKNRFGSTDEIGIFEMQDAGMVEVRDPSRAFLSERSMQAQGTAVVVTVEGTRPLLLEIQSLVTGSAFGLPRRSVTGIDLNRLYLLVAVLEKRAGLALGQQDIFVNVAGGARIAEPAADLGVAMAIASNVRMRALGEDWVVVGEVGLAGEIRRVSQLERRLAEAEKLGFQHALIPPGKLRRESSARLRLHVAETVSDAIELCFN